MLVRNGDRLGVYFEDAPSAVAYVFDENHPSALSALVDEPVPVNNVTLFDSLDFPYDFSLAGYFTTNIDQYNVTNDTDAADVGAQYVDCPVGMRIDDFVPLELNTTTAVPVTGRPGDTGATGPSGDVGATGPMGATGEQGVGLPGATGETGPLGPQGAMGDMGMTGATGPMGRDGSVGATGPRGERGPPGDVTVVGNGTALASTDDDDDDSVTVVSIILLVWLIILTIVLLILLVCLCVAYRRYRRTHGDDKPHHHLHHDYANGGYDDTTIGGTRREKDNAIKYTTRTPSYLDGQPTWTSTMKSIAESTYSNDTLDDAASNPGSEPRVHVENETTRAPSTLSSDVSHAGSQSGLVTSAPLAERQVSELSERSLDSKFAI